MKNRAIPFLSQGKLEAILVLPRRSLFLLTVISTISVWISPVLAEDEPVQNSGEVRLVKDAEKGDPKVQFELVD